jgi:hypothetical protein
MRAAIEAAGAQFYFGGGIDDIRGGERPGLAIGPVRR